MMVGCYPVGSGQVVQDLAATVETLIAQMPEEREDLAGRIACVWHSYGGTPESIEAFVRYWLAADREWRRLLAEQRESGRRAVDGALRTHLRGVDAA